MRAIACLCDPTGRIFSMMAHPEAHLFPWNHPRWTRQLIAGAAPSDGQGLAHFRNAVAFAREKLDQHPGTTLTSRAMALYDARVAGGVR